MPIQQAGIAQHECLKALIEIGANKGKERVTRTKDDANHDAR